MLPAASRTMLLRAAPCSVAVPACRALGARGMLACSSMQHWLECAVFQAAVLPGPGAAGSARLLSSGCSDGTGTPNGALQAGPRHHAGEWVRRVTVCNIWWSALLHAAIKNMGVL